MPYSGVDTGGWSKTYARGLTQGVDFTMGAVREPNLRFVREFTIQVSEDDSTGGLMVQHEGETEQYAWRVAASPKNFQTTGLIISLEKGGICRAWCSSGFIHFTWRERYEVARW